MKKNQLLFRTIVFFVLALVILVKCVIAEEPPAAMIPSYSSGMAVTTPASETQAPSQQSGTAPQAPMPGLADMDSKVISSVDKEEKAAELIEEESVDDYGNRVTITKDGNGNMISRVTTVTNDSGVVTKKTTEGFDANGKMISQKLEYFYDNGNPKSVLETRYDPSNGFGLGEIIFSEQKNYDESGQLHYYLLKEKTLIISTDVWVDSLYLEERYNGNGTLTYYEKRSSDYWQGSGMLKRYYEEIRELTGTGLLIVKITESKYLHTGFRWYHHVTLQEGNIYQVLELYQATHQEIMEELGGSDMFF